MAVDSLPSILVDSGERVGFGVFGENSDRFR